jgi:hypothetical protein
MAHTLTHKLEEEETKTELPMFKFKENLTPSLEQSSGIAPRTFEVIQRGLLKKERDELLGSYDEAAIAARRSAAELAREGVRDVPTGSGIRAGAARRMAQEMGPILTDIQTKKTEKAYETRPDIMAAGHISSDQMLKMTTYEQLIQKAWNEGKDMARIAQMIRAWQEIEEDQHMVLWLEDRGMGYPGFGESPSQMMAASGDEATPLESFAHKASFGVFGKA